MFKILEKYDKDEAPIVVYRVDNKQGEEQNSFSGIDIKIDNNLTNVSLESFFDFVKKLNGNVWIVCNWKYSEALEEHRKEISNLKCFYLIESEEVNNYFKLSFCIHIPSFSTR